MAIISKISCGLLALMNMMVAINHLKDPVESLKGFGVVGPISPVAAHCCAIIGSSSFPVVGMLLYSIFAPANVRQTLTLCYLSSIPPSIALRLSESIISSEDGILGVKNEIYNGKYWSY